jgi:hypothetical protein
LNVQSMKGYITFLSTISHMRRGRCW